MAAHECMRSDLQIVGGGTALHALGLVVKQLAAIGAPYIQDILGFCQILVSVTSIVVRFCLGKSGI